MLFKFVVPSLAVLAVIASAQTTPAPTAAPVVRTVEEIVATAAQAGLKGPKAEEAIKERAADILREEIDTLLLVQKGKDLPGLTVDAEVTKFFNNLQAQYKFND